MHCNWCVFIKLQFTIKWTGSGTVWMEARNGSPGIQEDYEVDGWPHQVQIRKVPISFIVPLLSFIYTY